MSPRRLTNLVRCLPNLSAGVGRLWQSSSHAEGLKPCSILGSEHRKRYMSTEKASPENENKGSELAQAKQYAQEGLRVGRRERFPYSPRFADLWDPWLPSRSMRQMLDMVDRAFDNFDIDPTDMGSTPELQRSVVRPSWDAQETDDAFFLRVDMPGLSKDEVKVQIEEGDVLVIRGEHNEENKNDVWKSSRYGSYQTRVELPDNCQLDQIKAELEHGVLTVTVPKSVPEQKVIEIPIS